MKNKLTGIGIALLIFNCASKPEIVDVQNIRTKSEQDRNALYESNKVKIAGFTSPYFLKNDTYSGGELSDLIDQSSFVSETTRSAYSTAQTYNRIGKGFFIGGAALWVYGFSGFGELAKEEGKVYLYSLAGGLASWGIALIFGGISKPYYDDAFQHYNDDLYRALELSSKTSNHYNQHSRQVTHELAFSVQQRF